MEFKDIILTWLVLIVLVSLAYLLWKQINSGKKTCSKCGTRYEGERCPRCNGYCFKCNDWYEGNHCPKCTQYCPKCGKWYKGLFCTQCGGPVSEEEIGYKTENVEYAAEHQLWICAYCETLNEGGETVKSSAVHGSGIKTLASKPCICCGKSGAKILEKRSVNYVL